MADINGHIIAQGFFSSSLSKPSKGGDQIPILAVSGTPDIEVSPNANSLLTRNTPVILTVTSNTPFRRVFIQASYIGLTLWEVVHNGDSFSPNYSNVTNGRNSIEGGYSYTLMRDGGWPGAPTFTVFAVDAFGGEN